MRNVDKFKQGDWIFTCNDVPVQFDYFEPRNPEDYNKKFIKSLSEDELSDFINDGFVTTDGASHSVKNCTCTLVSEAYAKWFLVNNVHRLFNKFKDEPNAFDLYENEVDYYVPNMV